MDKRTKNITDHPFTEDKEIEWDIQSDTVKRKIMLYDDNMMLVKVAFRQGGIGEAHAHPHTQITYIADGVFEVEIDAKKKTLKTGDAFYVPSNSLHGVRCLEDGMLIDIFHPSREDFLL